MNILITGAKGYVGSTLIRALSNTQHSVTGVSRAEFDLTNSSHTREWFTGKFFDVVIHTAISGGKRGQEDSALVLDNNLKMYYNLLENELHYNRFINIGSGAEMEHRDTPYGLSKAVIYESLMDRNAFYNVRVYGLFDENELDTRFIKANILRYIKKQSMQIHTDIYMDFFYMKDFISIINHYISADAPRKEITCAYDRVTRLSEVTDIINQLSDYTVGIHIQNPSTTGAYIGGFARPVGGVKYIGLNVGINEVYNALLTKEDI